MNQSPTTQGNLSRTATKAVRGLIPLMLLVSISGIGAQRKGAKPAAKAAPTAVATNGVTGTIRGRVLDSANGEAMIGVTAVIKDLGVYGITDIDGNYVITNVPVGEQTVTYQITGYQPSATKVNVGTGKAAVANVTLNYKVSSEVVVTAKRVDNTAASLLSKQKKAAAAQDAISAEQISKSPDSDAGDAAKRVTGVSIVGNGMVFVRGLSERYSSILVNDAPVPSPLPNKRVIPLDVFPVSLLDNLIVAKTFLPSMPADVAGGLVQINTKEYPEEMEAKATIGFGWNSLTTGQAGRTFAGSKLDALGYNDGTYSVPSGVSASSLQPTADARVLGFNTILSLDQKTMGADYSVSGNFGKTYKISDSSELGLLVGAGQKQTNQNIEGFFRRLDLGNADSVNYAYKQTTTTVTNNSQLQVAFRADKLNKFKLNTFYTHNAEKQGRENRGLLSAGGNSGRREILKFTENSLYFSQLIGEHALPSFLDSKLTWQGSFSRAEMSMPDTRLVRYDAQGGINQTAPIQRFYTNYNENNVYGDLNLAIPFNQWSGLKSIAKFGGGTNIRWRDNSARRFDYTNWINVPSISDRQNIPVDTLVAQNGITVQEITGTGPTFYDAYKGDQIINFGYGELDLPLVPQVRLVSGARYELWSQETRSYDQFKPQNFSPALIKGANILPSANLIYNFIADANLRLGYSRTINRPDFIEASKFRYFDELETGAIIEGNPNLKTAFINNFDTRVEWYPSVGDIIAVSGFYKKFENPIESTIFESGGNFLFSYRNQQSATIIGAEFEIRKNLGFISDFVKDFAVLTNYTFSKSEIELAADLSNQNTDSKRPLQGQSPWLVNAGLFYDKANWGSSFTLLYNVFGPRIRQVGIAGLQNIYEEPYGRLDAVIGQKIWHGQFKLALSNLLNPEIQEYYGTGADRQLVASYRRGYNIGISYSHSF
jgi:outer membrane receptor protein involved in Fe transport